MAQGTSGGGGGGVEGPGRGRTSAAVGHAAQATARRLPSPPSPRPEKQGRRQRLMPWRAGFGEDSGSDPQTPCPARTLKLSSRRHRLPARPPTAPLLSGLLAAPAQCQRPRDSARSEHARPCSPRPAKVPAQAHRRPARRPTPLPHPPKTWREELSSSDSPSRRAASGAGGLPLLRRARGVNSAALPRHGIVRMPADASASSAQSSGTNPVRPVTAPFGASTFLIGLPATRWANTDWSFQSRLVNRACQSAGLLGYCVHHLISFGQKLEDP